MTLAAVATVVVILSMGRWQLSRAAQKEAIQVQVQARSSLPVLEGAALHAVLPEADWTELIHRQVVLEGHWLAEGTRYLANRPHAGRAGFVVVTPFRIHNSEQVLVVQRGWAPRDPVDLNRVPQLSTPLGKVRVAGRLAPFPSRMYELGREDTGHIRQNLDPVDFGAELGVQVAPASLLMHEPQDPAVGPGADGLLRQWSTTLPDVHKHYGYAFQWFGLSALVVVLYVWFQIIVPRRRIKSFPSSGGG